MIQLEDMTWIVWGKDRWNHFRRIRMGFSS